MVRASDSNGLSFWVASLLAACLAFCLHCTICARGILDWDERALLCTLLF